jgi:aminoglycoside phosphotransferase (APT) family kinase protein
MTDTTNLLFTDESPRTRLRRAPALTVELANRLLSRTLSGRRVVGFDLLSGGLVNANFKIHLDPPGDPLVLRFYTRDPATCQKEVDLYHLLSTTVPVPEVIYAEPEGIDGVGPFALLSYVEGIPFRELRRTLNMDAIAEAAFDVGKTLAAIGEHKFPEAGWFGPGLEIGGQFIDGPDSVARFCESCLASPNFLRRVDNDLARRVHDFAWSWSSRLAWIDNGQKDEQNDDCSLVHGDFGSRNLLVRPLNGKWGVAAVIDWEFAFSGSPMLDIGNFLRYERRQRPLVEPHFSQGFLARGGTLRENWRDLARVIDLTALCESLTRDELPTDVESELLDLVRATIENRDPP